MKFSFLAALLICTSQINTFAQDLIVSTKNDSIKCIIKKFDADSTVYYKPKVKHDIYTGILKKDFYSEIVKDYYTDIRRNNNPNGSLGFFGLGVQYAKIESDPIIKLLFDSNALLRNLSSGPYFTCSFQRFIGPKKKSLNSEILPGNLSLGVSLGYFRRAMKLDNIGFSNMGFVDADLMRQVSSISLIFSYNTKNRYATYFAIKPGIMLSNYSGIVNNIPYKFKTTLLNMGVSVNQKLLDVGNRFLLFLVVEPFVTVTKTAKINSRSLDYYQTVSFYKDQYDKGFSAGLLLKYFF